MFRVFIPLRLLFRTQTLSLESYAQILSNVHLYEEPKVLGYCWVWDLGFRKVPRNPKVVHIP